jgi:hypothetical protein
MNDVLITGYRGGLGSGFIDVNGYNPSVGKFGRTPNDSIMVFMISRHAVMGENSFSLTGNPIWVDRQGNVTSVDRLDGHGYEVADYYNAVWGFNGMSWNGPSASSVQESKYLNQVVTPNSVVFKSMAFFRNPQSGDYTETSGQTGHFKDGTVGRGMHRARIGETTFKNAPADANNFRHPIALP